MKTIVIHHSADYDGLFCREIARKFLPDAVLIGWDYGDPVPQLPEDLDRLFLLDVSIDALMSNPALVLIYHHKSAIEKYGKLPGYQIDGVAACRLAWQYFTHAPGEQLPTKVAYQKRHVDEPLAVTLAGEYDIWDHRGEPGAEDDINFQFGLDAAPQIPWGAFFGPRRAARDRVNNLVYDGAIARRAIAKRNAEVLAAKGFDLRWEGTTFLALNTPFKGSLIFEGGYQPHHEGCLVFSFDGKQWTISMYGAPDKPEVDLSKIAVKYGGGGHKQACGFVSAALPWLEKVVD